MLGSIANYRRCYLGIFWWSFTSTFDTDFSLGDIEVKRDYKKWFKYFSEEVYAGHIVN